VTGWDVIVVGAGSAGSIVATRLAEQGRRVLLVEAGPDFPELASIPSIYTTEHSATQVPHDWGYVSEGDRQIPLPRGRLVGGSSAAARRAHVAVAALQAARTSVIDASWGGHPT